ncbi:ArnT family glycosyltransferase [Pirellula sp. SH-Sr6A]|uniref:ArnT family glycosyltransferase n=1 Tax=Pirellula sp. SH-Sr6A TaxID=1632865 RepID=UPI00197C4AF9|nr:glycosyltransferase family 39 protein [Pirellula sp. SH-Sr6A]
MVAAFALRISAAIVWQSGSKGEASPFRFGDSHSYWVLAEQIAHAKPYQYGSENARIFRAPLYPLFLSMAVWITGEEGDQPDWASILLARTFGILIGLSGLGIVMHTAKELAGSVAGIVAGLLATIYPGAIGMSVFLLSEAVFCPLMLLALYGSWRSLRSESLQAQYTWGLVAGTAIGLGCLARPSWSLWGVALGAYVLIGAGWRMTREPPWSWKAAFGSLALTAFAIVLTMSPWWIRNYQITGKFVPTTLQVGASLYDGWHEGATGSSDEGMAFTLEHLLAQQQEDIAATARGEKLESTFEWRADRRMRQAAVSWAWENPSEVLRLAGVKLLKTWRPIPVAAELGNTSVKVAEGAIYLAIALLGVVGVWGTRRQAGAWIFLLPCLYFSLLHMVFIGSVRYRQPAVLVLCILAGAGASLIMTHRSRRNREQGTT